MRKISFKKVVEVVAEVPDDFFHENGAIYPWDLARWVEQNECEYIEKDEESGVNYSQWQNTQEGQVQEVRIYPKDMEYCSIDSAEVVIDKKQFDEIMSEIYDAERCDECTGYGDDYDFEGNCNCDGCSSNRTSYHNDALVKPLD